MNIKEILKETEKGNKQSNIVIKLLEIKKEHIKIRKEIHEKLKKIREEVI